MNDPITPYFTPLLGLPCWGVDKVQGGILSFEFGAPRLSVREPIVASDTAPPAVRSRLAQRRVKPVGAWDLMIFSHWRWLSHGVESAHDESSDEAIRAAVRNADGQKLVSVELDARQKAMTFAFDLGGILATWPNEADNEEQWYLGMPDQTVLSYRADGYYRIGPSSVKIGERVWIKS